jgi:hypothetical protein
MRAKKIKDKMKIYFCDRRLGTRAGMINKLFAKWFIIKQPRGSASISLLQISRNNLFEIENEIYKEQLRLIERIELDARHRIGEIYFFS